MHLGKVTDKEDNEFGLTLRLATSVRLFWHDWMERRYPAATQPGTFGAERVNRSADSRATTSPAPAPRESHGLSSLRYQRTSVPDGKFSTRPTSS